VPKSGDVDFGTAEFSPNKTYFDKGWNPKDEIKYDWWNK